MELLQTLTKIHPGIWLLVSALFIALGDCSLKLWANSPSTIGVIRTILIYAGSTLAWFPALYQKNELAILGTIWGVMIAVVTAFLGVFVFKEVLELHHWLGIFFALVAIGLLSY